MAFDGWGIVFMTVLSIDYLCAIFMLSIQFARILVEYRSNIFHLNCYQKHFLHKELKTLGALLPVFQNMAPELIQEASQVLDEVLEALAMDG